MSDHSELRKLDLRHVWHPYTRRSTLDSEKPPLIARGEGLYLIDEEGRKYADAISSWWCCALGHGFRPVIEAIQRQAAILQHSILGNLGHEPAARLAGRLAGLMPDDRRHVLFASDGASAVEQALKISLQYWHNLGQPRRQRFACLQQAYHGDTFGAMGVGYLDEWHRPFRPLVQPGLALPIGPPGEPAKRRGEYFPPRSAEAALDLLNLHKDDLAAVIVEPLCLGASGMIMYGAAWLKTLAAWCRANRVLFIVDEIAMAFGRTGRMFAFEHAGLNPDIVCVGKALTAGYLPLSATIVSDLIYGTFMDQPADKTLQHGHTFCGNPMAAAAALAALDAYCDPAFLTAVCRRGELLHKLVEPLARFRHVQEVRCLGLIAAVELTAEPGVARDDTRPHRIRRMLRERGILLRPLGNVVYLMPPLVTTDQDLGFLTSELEAAIAAIC